eukprot:Hpha_TRINITY_DN22076_c0_g1::TRINITY_DN22076_c0_g1_i1::g.112158::m.112158
MSGLLLFVHHGDKTIPVEVDPSATIQDVVREAGLDVRFHQLRFQDETFAPTSDNALADIGVGQQSGLYVVEVRPWLWKDNKVPDTEGTTCMSPADVGGYSMTRAESQLNEGDRVRLRLKIVKKNNKVHDFGLISTNTFDFEAGQRTWQQGCKKTDQGSFFCSKTIRIEREGHYIDLVLDDKKLSWYRVNDPDTAKEPQAPDGTFMLSPSDFPLTPVVQHYDAGAQFKLSQHEV